MPPAPLVTVLLAVHDGERYVRAAVASALGQTLRDLELLVVDDASSDQTAAILSGIGDPRLRVIRNDDRLGLAASLNRGLDESRGTWIARLDADDVALPRRLEVQLARLRAEPRLDVLGSAVLEVDDANRLGHLHRMPAAPDDVRWALLFSSPFFHPSVLFSRELLDRGGLRYDTTFEESEDYDLWARALETGTGANVEEPLLLYRVHGAQASRRRRDVQRACQLRVALRLIGALAPGLSASEGQLAWSVGVAERVAPDESGEAAEAYLELLHAFEERTGGDVRSRAARDLMRLADGAHGAVRARIAAGAMRLDPTLPLSAVAGRRGRRRQADRVRHEAEEWLRRVADERAPAPTRVAAVFPEPTPYRAPLLDRVAEQAELDLTVLYAAGTVAGRSWRVEPKHRAVRLRGLRVPGAARVLHHDYPLTPGVVPELEQLRPDVVVVSGWSTFAAQAAIAWCRLRDVPYLLVVESHDEGPRPGWRRAVKDTVVPPVVAKAAGVLVTGTLARKSMVARGAPADRVRVFANTVDVEAFGSAAARLATRRGELRAALDADADDVVVLSVARLAPEKGLDVLIRAVAAVDDPRLVLAVAGSGPERDRLDMLARDAGVRLTLAGDVEWHRIVELYAAADVFALLSEREPWAVVVNEAAACGLPLVLSDRVGAAHDLLRDGENGVLVPAGDVEAAAAALRELASDSELRRTQGARSRELARDWGYGPSVEGFLEAVREAVAERRR